MGPMTSAAARLGLRFGLFALASLVARAWSLTVDVIDIDEASHAVGSWVTWSGGLLYTDFVNNKPPLLYAYYGAAQALLGAGLIPIRLLTILVVVPGTAMAASAFFDHDRRGLVAGLIAIVFGAAFIGHDVLSVNTEILLLLPAAWAVVMVRRPEPASRVARFFAAGALLGTAFLLKYHAAAWLPVLAWASLQRPWGRRSLAPAIALGAGFALPLAGVWMYFAARDGEAALLYWTLANNVSYSANDVPASEWAGRFAAALVPFLLTTAPLWWLWRRQPADEADSYRDGLVTALLGCSMLAALWGLRFYPHYLVPVYWPLAVAAAPAATRLFVPMRRPGLVLAGYAIALLVAFTASTATLYASGWRGKRVYRETDPVFARVADRLRADACAADASLFVWGYGAIFYYESRMRPASRFVVLPQSHLTGYVSGNLASVRHRGPDAPGVVPQHWDWLLADLERNAATFILDTAPARIYRWDHYPVAEFPRLQEYLASNYDLVDTVDEVGIYRRHGCLHTPAPATPAWKAVTTRRAAPFAALAAARDTPPTAGRKSLPFAPP
jgi:hypothetical protein